MLIGSFQIQLLNTFSSESDGVPSSVDFVRDDSSRIVASFSSSHSVIFDVETGKQLLRLESTSQDGVTLSAKKVGSGV